MNKSALIGTTKSVVVAGRTMIIVTTQDNQVIWVPQAQFDASAEAITYLPRKKGDKYAKADGTEGVLKQDRNDFVGFNAKPTKAAASEAIMAFLLSKGVTPMFSFS